MFTGHELGSVIEKVDEGSTLTLIAGQIADVAAEAKCKTMVATLIGHPERRVTFTLRDVARRKRRRSPASRSFIRGGTRLRTPSSSASWPACSGFVGRAKIQSGAPWPTCATSE